MSGSKKFYISMLSIITFVCVLLGVTFCVRHAYGNVVDPTPDNPTPDTELACVFDRDWFDQISGMGIEVTDDTTGASKTETITKESIKHFSFGKTSTGTYLGKTTSGIDVYYTRSDDGKYSVDFVSDKTISAPTNCDNLFSGCSSLTSMDFSNFDTSNATSSNNMFSGCDSFNSVTGSSNYGLGNLPSSTTGKSDISETIASETATNLGINRNNISKISFLQASDKTYLTTLNSGIVTYYSQDEDGNFELDFVAHKIYAPENCSSLFSSVNLKSIDFTNFDTSNVTNMSHMFECDTLLESLCLSNFDTSNVTDMSYMFYECRSLIDLDLSNFNTSNVTNMSCMFGCCNKIPYLDLSSFDTRNVTSYDYMFAGCNSLYNFKIGENYTLDNLYFSVKFHVNDEIVSEQTIALNHTAEPVIPELDGCTFLYWILQDVGEIVDVENYPVTANMDLWPVTEEPQTPETYNYTFGTDSFSELYTNESSIQLGLTNKDVIQSISFSQSSDKTYLTTLNCGIAVCYSITEDNRYELDLVAEKIYAPTDSSRLFYSFDNLVSLDFSNFDTSNVTNMTDMFLGCKALTTLNISNFDTSNVISMYGMFDGCKSLQTLNLSNFDTRNVTNMSFMFYNCSSLTSLNLSNFDTSNVTNMSYMFEYCNRLTDLSLSNFDTSNVTSMRGMFDGCKSLQTLNLSNFDTRNVTDMSYMFCHLSNLTALDVSSFNTGNVISMCGMFSWCSSLKSLNLSSFDTSNVACMSQMFEHCVSESFYILDLSNFNTSNVTDMNRMFYDCWNLMVLDLSNFDTRNVVNYADMFAGCGYLDEITTGENYTLDNLSFRVEFWALNELCNTQTVKLNYYASYVEAPSLEGYYFVGWRNMNTNRIYNNPFIDYCVWENVTFMAVYEINGTLSIDELFNNSSAIELNINQSTTNSMSFLQASDKTYLTTLNSGIDVYYTSLDGVFYALDLVADKIYAPTDSSRLFYSFDNLVSLDFSNFDTSNVTNMTDMFLGCIALTTLNISNFDTSNVISMYGMFDSCKSLQTLNLSNFDTRNVTNMSFMFNNCSSLTSLNLSNFDTSNVTDMSGMFRGCKALTTLNISNFDTSNVTSMRGMFDGCKSLQTLNLSNFDTRNVTNMSYMFAYCSSLTSLNLSNFDTSNVTDMSGMFQGCTSLTTLDLSNFDTTHIYESQDRVFSKCGALTITATENFTITPPDGSTIVAPTTDVVES